MIQDTYSQFVWRFMSFSSLDAVEVSWSEGERHRAVELLGSDTTPQMRSIIRVKWWTNNQERQQQTNQSKQFLVEANFNFPFLEATFETTKDVVLTFSKRRPTLSRGAKCQGVGWRQLKVLIFQNRSKWYKLFFPPPPPLKHESFGETWGDLDKCDAGAPSCSRSVRACGGSESTAHGRPIKQLRMSWQ